MCALRVNSDSSSLPKVLEIKNIVIISALLAITLFGSIFVLSSIRVALFVGCGTFVVSSSLLFIVRQRFLSSHPTVHHEDCPVSEENPPVAEVPNLVTHEAEKEDFEAEVASDPVLPGSEVSQDRPIAEEATGTVMEPAPEADEGPDAAEAAIALVHSESEVSGLQEVAEVADAEQPSEEVEGGYVSETQEEVLQDEVLELLDDVPPSEEAIDEAVVVGGEEPVEHTLLLADIVPTFVRFSGDAKDSALVFDWFIGMGEDKEDETFVEVLHEWRDLFISCDRWCRDRAVQKIDVETILSDRREQLSTLLESRKNEERLRKLDERMKTLEEDKEETERLDGEVMTRLEGELPDQERFDLSQVDIDYIERIRALEYKMETLKNEMLSLLPQGDEKRDLELEERVLQAKIEQLGKLAQLKGDKNFLINLFRGLRYLLKYSLSKDNNPCVETFCFVQAQSVTGAQLCLQAAHDKLNVDLQDFEVADLETAQKFLEEAATYSDVRINGESAILSEAKYFVEIKYLVRALRYFARLEGEVGEMGEDIGKWLMFKMVVMVADEAGAMSSRRGQKENSDTLRPDEMELLREFNRCSSHMLQDPSCHLKLTPYIRAIYNCKVKLLEESSKHRIAEVTLSNYEEDVLQSDLRKLEQQKRI